MRILRWVFAALYLLILAGLFGFAYSSDLPDWLSPFYALKGKLFWTVFVLAVTIFSQALFVFATARIDLHRPGSRYWVILPAAIAALLLGFLTYAFGAAAYEFLRADFMINILSSNTAFFVIVGAFWLAWGVIFYRLLKNKGRHETMKNLVTTLLAGSLLELLPAMLMHFAVSRRGGCFVGMYTGLGVSIGVIVMLWSFGPGIIFLFMDAKYRAELRENRNRSKVSQAIAGDDMKR